MCGEASYDAEVEVHYPAALNLKIARMRVGVEETIIQYLLGEVVYKLGAYLLKVIALTYKTIVVTDGDTIHVVHDNDVLGAEFGIGHGAIHELAVCVVVPELCQAADLDQEVRLLQKGLPELVYH